MECIMLLPGVIIYIIASYAVLSTLFTPVIALIVQPGLRKAAGISCSFFNMGNILAANIAIFVVALRLNLTILFVCCTFICEIVLWIILTIIIRKQVILKFRNDFFNFFPHFRPKLKNFLLQPLFFFNLIDNESAPFLKILFMSILLFIPMQFIRVPIIKSVDNTAIKSDCAILMPDAEITIKSISNNEITYTNGKEKKWYFYMTGDGLYIPEGEYIFLCDFYKGGSEGEKAITYSFNDIRITGKLEKGKAYYLKHSFKILEDDRFPVSLFLIE
jgi:hypothetical protein